MNRTARTAAFIVLVATVGACARVDDSEQGLKTSNGRVKGCTSSGLQWFVPFVQKIKTYPKGVQSTDMLESDTEGDRKSDDGVPVISSDRAGFIVDVTINYRVSEECQQRQYLYRQGIKSSDAIKDRLVRPAARDAVRTGFARFTVKDGTTSKREEVAQLIKETLNAKLAVRPALGAISVDSVELRNFYLSDAIATLVQRLIESEANNQKATLDRKTEETQAETKLLVAQKGALEKAAVAEGDAAKTRTQADAAAYAAKTKAGAEAEANTKVAASLTPALLELKIAEAQRDAIKGANSKVIVTGGAAASGSADTSSVILDAR